jgi:mannose-6-phosphate isomerase-like protein (cupin superfamily)
MKKRWGWHLTLLKGKHFKVKLLYFKKGGEISAQRHQKRHELWIWIKGHRHGLFNNLAVAPPYKEVPLNTWHHYRSSSGRSVVLEIQYGLECREDDIERR